MQSANVLRNLQLSAPHAYRTVAPRYSDLMVKQMSLERQGGRAQNGQLGFVPLLIASGIAATGFFAWLTSRQLTESTDYKSRLKCVDDAMSRGASEENALKICGFESKLSFTPLAVAGVAGLALYFLMKK